MREKRSLLLSAPSTNAEPSRLEEAPGRRLLVSADELSERQPSHRSRAGDEGEAAPWGGRTHAWLTAVLLTLLS
jgi:hypothetical protein